MSPLAIVSSSPLVRQNRLWFPLRVVGRVGRQSLLLGDWRSCRTVALFITRVSRVEKRYRSVSVALVECKGRVVAEGFALGIEGVATEHSAWHTRDNDAVQYVISYSRQMRP